MIEQAVISAGGQGLRMSTHFPNAPKALNRVGKLSLLEHATIMLVSNNIKRIHLLLGFYAEKILETLPALSEHYGVEFSYTVESTPLGTGGALLNALDRLDENFLYFYGDLYLNLELSSLAKALAEPNISFVQMVHPSNHPFDSDLLILNELDIIIGYRLKPHPQDLVFNNIANAGIYGFKKSVLSQVIKSWTENKKIDLDRQLLPKILALGCIGKGVRNTGYVKDAGTPERLEEIRKDFTSGICGNRYKPAIFFDRDGTLNRENGHIAHPDALQIYDDVGPFISKLNQAGYRVFLITNQPVVARGEASLDTLKLIHAKLETEIAKHGGFFDAIKYCPHHPDNGYMGEVPEFKIVCGCRKPKIGMIEEVCNDFPTNLNRSVFIGNSDVDRDCALHANIAFYRIDRESKFNSTPNSLSFDNFFKDFLLKQFES